MENFWTESMFMFLFVEKFLIPLVYMLITALIGYAIAFLRTKIHNVLLNDYIDKLEVSAYDVVRSLQQQMVDQMKADKDGKLTETDINELKQIAVDTLMTTIPLKAKTFLESEYDNLAALMLTKIHSALKDMKTEELPILTPVSKG